MGGFIVGVRKDCEEENLELKWEEEDGVVVTKIKGEEGEKVYNSSSLCHEKLGYKGV